MLMAAEPAVPVALSAAGLSPSPGRERLRPSLSPNGLTAARLTAVGAATCAAAVAPWQSARRRRSRAAKQTARGAGVRLRAGPQDSNDELALDVSSAPANLYEFLGVREDANPAQVKKAYYDLQKICHPDVAGEDGEEMCILLNDAYDVLASEQSRMAYDQSLGSRSPVPDDQALARVDREVSRDLEPTWKWKPKRHGVQPVWDGMPRSRSVWHKVPEDKRGEKHAQQMFMFVDEWSCINCRNCCDVAPRTFCIDADSGRARVYSQWGNGEEALEYAVMACPVDCISWVTREELQRLEFVTADTIFEKGPDSMPCPMKKRQGLNVQNDEDPFDLAEDFQRRLEEEEERAKKALGGASRAFDFFAERIGKVVARLPSGLLGRMRDVWRR